jgi:hypothetical protein
MRVQGPRSNKWSIPIGQGDKLDPRPLDEDLRPFEAKLRWHLHGTILEGSSISLDQKMELKGKLMVWKTNM